MIAVIAVGCTSFRPGDVVGQAPDVAG